MEQYIKGASNRDDDDSYSDDKDQSYLQTQYGNYDEGEVGDYHDGSPDSQDSSSSGDDDEPDPFESFIKGTNNPFATFTFSQTGMYRSREMLTY
jgi:hypothetical protein